MTVDHVMSYLHTNGNESAKQRILRTGTSLDSYGTSMKDIRSLAKQLGSDHTLAMKLFDTNVYEAMMLATILADPAQMNPEILTRWAKQARSTNIVNQGLSSLMLSFEPYDDLLRNWCVSSDVDLRYAGFTVLSSYFRSEELENIDHPFSQKMLEQIVDTISTEPLEIQNAMNNAVVMAGLHVPNLVEQATKVADQIGYILPLVAKNKCNIQSASDYLVRYLDQPKYSRVARLKHMEEAK